MTTTTLVIGGTEVEIPEGTPPDIIRKLIGASQGSQGGSPAQAPMAPPKAQGEGSIDPSTLYKNKDWLNSSRVLYRRDNGADFKGSDQELAEYGLEQMGWFNYNLPRMALDAAKIENADREHKQAFLHLMETYDDLQLSWGGVGRFFKGVLTDPTTYIGLSTMGFGSVASGATKIATKEGVKSLLKAGTIGAIEGGILTGAQESIRQDVEVSTGRRTEKDMGDIALQGAIGAGAGAVLGGAIDGAGTLLRGRARAKEMDSLLNSPQSPASGQAGQAAPSPASAAPQPSTASVAPANALPAPGPAAQTVSGLPAEIIPPVKAGEILPAAPEGPMRDAPWSTTNPVIEDIRKLAIPTGGRDMPNPMGRGIDEIQPAIERLLKAGPDDIPLAIEQVRRMAGGPEERSLIDVTVREATRRLDEMHGPAVEDLKSALKGKDQAAIVAARQALDEINILRSKIKTVDTELSSNQGSALGSRANNDLFNTGENRGLEVEDFLRERGVDPARATPEDWDRANIDYQRAYDRFITKARASREYRDLEQEIQDLYEAGDIAGALAKVQRRAEIAQKIADEEQKGWIVRTFNSTLNKINEYVISTVFTPATIMVNFIPSMVKTLGRPFVDFVVRGGPFGEAAGRQMIASYAAMGQSIGTAVRAARLAFKYERALLTDDGMRLLESDLGPAIKGTKGRLLRFFPKLLNATDEFFSQVAYRGFVAGQAAADAMALAAKQGIKDQAQIAKMVDQAIQDRVAGSVQKFDAPRVIEFLRRQGEDRGLSGKKLEHFIKTELDSNADLFRKAEDQSGVNYVDDLLFKRKFSGETKGLGFIPISKMAQLYEQAVNKAPIMRLMGQLFFRTPVRVFEEGFRLTAGLNLITPGFLNDLKGANGQARQLRAQGEALLSYAVAGSVMMMYANGTITGGGPGDYKQRRTMEDGKKWEPYTIRFADGTTFSFRNLDPFATPLKILVNAMDKYQDLMYRQAQGEFVDKKLHEEVYAWMGAATGAIAQAVRDASLTEGIDQIATLVESMADPERNDKAITKFFGQKGQLAVPNVISKWNLQDNPVMNDPATVWQFIEARMNPGDTNVPKQYDPLGKVRTVNNPQAALIGINVTSQEQREAGKDPKALAVIRELSAIEIATGRKFAAPHTVKDLPGVDLRTMPTSDGKTTMYDRWMQLYSQTQVQSVLHQVLVQGKQVGSYGTRGQDGIKPELANKIISDFRELAFQRLMMEERQLFTKSLADKMGKVDAQIGRKDVFWQPYQ
jgi:hypothetical protein